MNRLSLENIIILLKLTIKDMLPCEKREAYTILLSAANKQLPQIPFYKIEKYYDFDAMAPDEWPIGYICPSCKKLLGSNKDEDSLYCRKCGQALDWEKANKKNTTLNHNKEVQKG